MLLSRFFLIHCNISLFLSLKYILSISLSLQPKPIPPSLTLSLFLTLLSRSFSVPPQIICSFSLFRVYFSLFFAIRFFVNLSLIFFLTLLVILLPYPSYYLLSLSLFLVPLLGGSWIRILVAPFIVLKYVIAWTVEDASVVVQKCQAKGSPEGAWSGGPRRGTVQVGQRCQRHPHW